jgi:hypothetical protein
VIHTPSFLAPRSFGRRVFGVDYAAKVLATAPIAYWKLNDLSGIQATDYSGNGRHGTYTGVTLAGDTFLNGDPAPSFDGVNDNVGIYSTSLASAFNGNSVSIIFWFKTANWMDGNSRYVLSLGQDANNRYRFNKEASTFAHYFYLNAISGGVSKAVLPIVGDGWLMGAATRGEIADEVKFYLDGAQSGSTQSGLGVYSGSLTNTYTVIGAALASGGSYWHGSIAHVAIWDTPLSAPQIADLAVVA